MTDHDGLGSLVPEENLRELSDWLQNRVEPSSGRPGPKRGGRAPQAGPPAGGGRPPAPRPPEAPTLKEDARTLAAQANQEIPDTVRVTPRHPGPPAPPPVPQELRLPDDAPPTISDPRLGHGQVRGLGLGPTPAELKLGEAAPSGAAEFGGRGAQRGRARANAGGGRAAGPTDPARRSRAPIAADPEAESTGPLFAIPKQAPGRFNTATGRHATSASGSAVHYDAAPLWRRLVATLIDATVVIGLMAIPLRAGWFGQGILAIRPWEPDDIGQALFGGVLTAPLVIAALLFLLVGSVPHGLGGRTLGKLITGLKLVNNWTGDQPGWTQVVLRQVVGLATTALGAASYLWFIVDRRSSALHDRLTGTSCVIANSRVVHAARDPMG